MKKSKKVEVTCSVCKKRELVYPSRAKKYNTCSVKCMGVFNRAGNNVECCVCKKEFHVKPIRIKKIKNDICCSKKCINELKKTIYMGRKNPNTKYHNLDDNFFKEVNTDAKAYLLGWIASDGSLNENGCTNISINKKDKLCLENLRDIICKELHIVPKDTNLLSLSINSTTISNDICNLLNILPEKKSHIICFPELGSEELKWSFLRGFFDGDGSVSSITEECRSPFCKITTSSDVMRKHIKDFVGIPCNETGVDICWSGNNALDFLEKIYKNSTHTTRLSRKYELYLDISTWVPSVSYSRYFKNEHCQWSKSRKDAVSPFKVRASDSGYDLTLLEKIKTIGVVEYYDTGIKIKPCFGLYFQLVARSSLTKKGYILANSVGIIDRTYLGSVIVALIKIDKTAPDLELPMRHVQIIPTPIVHLQIEEVDDLDSNSTSRSNGGFGSTGKK